MQRPRLLTLTCVLSLIISAGGFSILQANAATTELHAVILVQSGFFVPTGDGCRVDTGDAAFPVLKIMNDENTQIAGLSLADGETIEATGPSGANQTYCAFVEAVDVGSTGVVRLVIDDVFLMSLNIDTFDPANHLVLEIDSKGLVAIDYATGAEVRALGLEPIEMAASIESPPAETGTEVTRTPRTSNSEPAPTETSTGITRTPRTGSAQPTAESVATPPDATVALQDSRDKLRESSQGGIVAGEWELEEPPIQNLLFVTINEDQNGVGPFTVRALGGEDLEDITGFPLLSEEMAPAGCRAFTLEGPYQTVLFVGICADGEYLMVVMGTDQDLVTTVMTDFVDGNPFTVPPGYEDASATWRPGERWVA